MERIANSFKRKFFSDRKRHSALINTKNEKTAIMTTFNNLPDEVIILILSQLVSNLDTILNIMKVSKRMSRLCLGILSQSTFPSYSIETIIDQEGRNRSFTQFEFQSVHLDTLCLSFVARSPSIRRYYTNKENPAFRQIALRNSTRSSSNGDNTRNATTGEWAFEKEKEDKKEENHQLIDDVTSEIPMNKTYVQAILETRNQKICKVKKEGRQSVQLFRSFSPSSQKNNQDKLLWKLEYQIDRKVNKEYCFTPLYLDVQFKYFIQLIQNKKRK